MPVRRLCGRSRVSGLRPARAARVLAGAALIATVVVTTLATAPAARAAPAQARPAEVTVVKVSGTLDPVLADFVEQSISQAEDRGAVWLVLWMNSSDTVVSDERVAELVERVRTAEVNVGIWVGQSRARAEEGAGQLTAVADAVSIGLRSRIGDFGDPAVDPARFRPAYRAALERLRDGTVDEDAARQLDLIGPPAPNIGDFLIGLEGVQTQRIETEDGPRRAPQGVVFRSLPLGSRFMHTIASPPVAYLLLIFGMALIVFELFTAGVGVAGLVGAGAFVFGCYGLAVLPARPVAVGLLVLSMVAFAVDVQTGVPRLWTGIGAAALVAGSLLLYDGVSVSWITLLAGIGGVLLFMLAGMPAMVRTRFSTPTIGRQWMIGEEGEAVAAVAPDGVVRIKGALWRARTNRATPLATGDPVRVVEVDGLLLEVEPLEGAAKDYRH
jgi:membrane-bound serine protease (ClpP class)